MSFQNPLNRTRRRSVAGMEHMHSKMFDPPHASVITPELLAPTNPVPAVMLAKNFLTNTGNVPANTITRELAMGETLDTHDGQRMNFFLFGDPNGITIPGPNGDVDITKGTFPGPSIRIPRGVIFHCLSGSKKGPHTIHWHGHEPTPMNDGVGHTSFELGNYTYQFQPNFIGTYFHHCHRNTVQHFEFGLYGLTIVDPPDAYFASIDAFNGNGTVTLNQVPVGASRDGKFRTAANLDPALNPYFARFGQDAQYRVPLTNPDPQANNNNLPAWQRFLSDPHAYTVHYDVEAVWVFDDRDIRWSNLMENFPSSEIITFPVSGTVPGVNDNFRVNGTAEGSGNVNPFIPGQFFAFNDFRSTHWYCTGVEFAGPIGGEASLNPGLEIPAAAMSGKTGVQVSVNALVGQNILIRVLNGAYDVIRVKFPVDVVIIAWDGRSLGIPPFTKYNVPVLVPAHTFVEFSTARRFDCLINSTVQVNDVGTVEFYDSMRRGQRRFTGKIPIVIT